MGSVLVNPLVEYELAVEVEADSVVGKYIELVLSG